MSRSAIKTSINDIVKYWAKYKNESDFSFDFSEAHEICWRCGCKKNLERCHIIPDSLGGKDEPSNLVLLCKRCHIDNPNVADPDIMWNWLKAYKVPFYNTFWNLQGMQEYKRIYSKSIKEELKDRKISNKNIDEFMRIYKEQFKKTSYHFGHPYLNVATIAGIYRMTLKEYDKKNNIETKELINPYINIGEYL